MAIGLTERLLIEKKNLCELCGLCELCENPTLRFKAYYFNEDFSQRPQSSQSSPRELPTWL
jgi:hypothetical protein